MRTPNPSLALALVRLATGAAFVAHGASKVFGMGIPAVAGFFGSVGIPLAPVAAVVVSLVEFGGGLLMLVGYQHRVVGALQAAVMVGAVASVKGVGSFTGGQGFELEFLLGTAALAIAVGGGGAWTLEERLARR